MKLISSVACILFLSLVFSLSIFAQRVETEGELFLKISRLTQTKKADDEAKAYELSKVFMSKFGKNDDNEVKKVKEFMANYEVSIVAKNIEAGKTAEAFAFGKEVLINNPDNPFLTMTLANGGYQAFVAKKDKTFGKDSILFAKKTLELFADINKVPSSYAPFADRDEATAMMYYVIGNFSIDSNLNEAAQNFYKALQYNSKVKNNSFPYYIIAFNYEKEYEKTAKEYDTKYGASSTVNAEMKAAEAKLEKLLSNMQDAYARAIKLGEAENAPKVGEWKQRYSQLYAFIKGSDAGSAEFLANVLTTPMPDPNAP
jgi:archaellum component FlaG (FlaF/FlaG flagellin family)